MAKAAKPMFPVALSRDIHPRSIARAMLDGTELVLWRDDDGIVHVWEDRCPHRSVRLSAGRNLGHGLQGVYHGWTFAKDGHVASVPAEGGKAHKDIRCTVFSSAEQDGFVWAAPAKAKIPDGLAVRKGDVVLRPLEVSADAKTVAEVIAGLSGLRAVVTPWNERQSVVFGVVQGVDGEAPNATARRWNGVLNAHRRAIEEAG